MAAGTSRFTAADFERHVERLKEKLPSDDFTIVVEPPFVVIGDEPTLRVKARAKDTVKWAVDRLKGRLFPAQSGVHHRYLAVSRSGKL